MCEVDPLDIAEEAKRAPARSRAEGPAWVPFLRRISQSSQWIVLAKRRAGNELQRKGPVRSQSVSRESKRRRGDAPFLTI